MQAKCNSVFGGEKYLKDGLGFLAKTQTPPVELFVYCTILQKKTLMILRIFATQYCGADQLF